MVPRGGKAGYIFHTMAPIERHNGNTGTSKRGLRQFVWFRRLEGKLKRICDTERRERGEIKARGTRRSLMRSEMGSGGQARR
jgi:hypothetical protein